LHCGLLDEFPAEAGRDGHNRSLPLLPGKQAKGKNAAVALKFMDEIEEYICQLLSMDAKVPIPFPSSASGYMSVGEGLVAWPECSIMHT